MPLTLSSDEHVEALTTLIDGFNRTDLSFIARDGTMVSAGRSVFYLCSEMFRSIIGCLEKCESEELIVNLPQFDSSGIKRFVDIVSKGSVTLKAEHEKNEVYSLSKVLGVEMNLEILSKPIADSGFNSALNDDQDNELDPDNDIDGDNNDNSKSSAMTDFAVSVFSDIVHESTRLSSSSPSGTESCDEVILKQVRVMLKKIDNTVAGSNTAYNARDVVTVSDYTETVKGKNSASICKVCQKDMKNRRGLLTHYSMVHFKQQLLSKFQKELDYSKKCNLCDRTYKDGNIRSRLIHIGVTHSKIVSVLNDLYPSSVEMNIVEDITVNSNVPKRSLKVKNSNSPKPSRRRRHAPNVDITSSDESLPVQRPRRSAKKCGPKSIPEIQFKCKVCGKLKKNKMKLLEHYTMSHFYDEMSEQFLGLLSSKKECKLCGQSCRYSENVGQRFIKHVGARHGKVLEILNKHGL